MQSSSAATFTATMQLSTEAGVFSNYCVALYALPAFYVLWTVYTWIYNLYFHPLSRFPGPKLAGMTGWWKAWVYIVKQDSIPRMFELHAQYGDVVRLAPDELHFSSPDAYNSIYHMSRRWTKEKNLYGKSIDGNSTLTLLDYHSAKKRREILLNHFSRKSVLELQYVIQERVDILCEAFKRQHAAGGACDFYHAFKCYALDAITSIAFAKPMNATLAPDFKSPMILAMDATIPTLVSFIQIPTLRKIFSRIPPSLLPTLNKTLKGYVDIRQSLAQQIKEILADPSVLTLAPHPIIYHSLLNYNPNKSADDKAPATSFPLKDLNEEAFLLVFAGSDTASNTITHGLTHCIENRDVYKAVKDELREAWPELDEKPKYEVLEKLPYLTAVIKESLRMSHGVVSPLLRYVPAEGATIVGHSVPGGAIVGVSPCFVHWNATVFPEPRKFKPERWLGPGAKDLEQYQVAFSKGPRSCVGVNLAWCELYLAFANVLRRFDLELDGVSSTDLRWRDCYLPLHLGPDMNVRATPVSS